MPDPTATSILAALPDDVGVAVVRRGDHLLVGAAPSRIAAADGAASLAALDDLEPGFWVGACAFELGHALERVPPRSASLEAPSVPDVLFARFDALAAVGPSGAVTVRGEGPGRVLLDAAVRAPAAPVALGAVGRWRSSLARDEFEDRVATVLDLLHAGECYQVNLTRRLEAAGALDPVALHAALAACNPAPHAGMLRLPAGATSALPDALAVVSASPEGFLRRHGTSVETRPIKGTAPSGAAGADTLRASAKDHAENVMIVDLARNDLGRVCVPGTMSVPELCAVEAHPGLHHLVSTVRGTLREGVGTADLLAATFPPASVTGAPKPRVLSIIEELEPVRRGVYCGAFGWIDTRLHEADLAVAIRTFTVHGRGDDGCTRLGVGGGIVADSRPAAEWDETCLKAARLLEAAGAGAPALVGGMSVDATDPFVWWNGAAGPRGGLCAASEVRISPFDHGLLVGDGVFETVRVYDGQPFAWRRHLERLEHSAAGLGLGLPTRDELRTAAAAVLEANGLLEARLRITVTGGLSPLGSERGQSPPTLVVAASEVVAGADATTVAISPWPRNEHGATAGLKTTSYAENVRALAYARELGATEAILENTQHQLCEATGSNVFVVSDGVVRTPPPQSGCLLGVTRALVLELGPSLGLRVEETPLPLRALVDEADEAFLTSTVREVQGIAEIAGWGHKFDDAPGPVTRTLAAAFDDLIASNLDP